HARDPGTLYRGTRLARTEEVFPGHRRDLALTEVERDFLTAAFDAREAERRAAARSTLRTRTLIGAHSALLAVALVGPAVVESGRGRQGRMLPTAADEAAGGLGGAIAASAEEVY
ncbi:hypothetical protein, partial [Streptomyces sp. SP18BB07]|uniref:hypothetical protein n=1 Tax=Streptomyces sp. SP18BB07 TaxID=3002522 RepID=UPI002E76BB6D